MLIPQNVSLVLRAVARHDGRVTDTMPRPTASTVDPEAVSALVRRWLEVAAELPANPSAQRLAGVLRDPKGLAFTVAFVDEVVRPEDLRVAARALASIAPDVPRFLPWPLRAAVRLGGLFAPILPGIVVPIARRVLRGMVAHLIIDATDSQLGPAIRAIKTDGIRLNINLLGEAVLGRDEAAHRLEGTKRLLRRDDVDYVSIKVSSTVAPHNPWAFDASVADIVAELAPLFQLAADAPTPKFINLDMEEYKDLDLTIAVFSQLLDRPEFLNLEAGIVLQAYLPDALAAMERLQAWSAARRARGGAGIKVRVVKGANLPMERVEADVHGWPLATWLTKQDSDAHYKRVLDYALHPDRIANVRIGVAGHNLFDIAYAWLLAGERGVCDSIEFEMLLGMAQSQAEAVRRDVGGLLLYTPVVAPAEFDVAIAYLIRRLEEGASADNFMSAVFELAESAPLFEREEHRFRASLAALADEVPTTHRVADRFAASPRPAPGAFANTPDTDPAVAGNRAWADAILERVPTSTIGADNVDALVSSTRKAAEGWDALGGEGRAAILEKAGAALEARRAEFLEVMAAEAGKTIDQADPEVSEAVDFAYYYAGLARDLDRIDGARFEPARLTLITPPWNFPVAIPAGSTLAALAAGSGVVLKPAALTARSASIIADALWEAGVPRDVLRFTLGADRTAGTALVSHPGVDRVILTGAYETAELFRSFRPGLPLLAETSGKNAIIVTPSADLDLAVKDVVQSAFGHAGQKCSAASLVVLVGSVARSRRFRTQLLDAVRSLTVGEASDPATRMGPLVEPAGAKLLSGLTELGPGERWLLKPEQLGEKLWTPGLRDGVARGSEFHRVEYFGPVLGIMTARTLDEAIDIVNAVDYGLTSGLQSLDAGEIARWTDRIEAGNLYVNRGTTGAIVRRQPFGGWKKSSVGPGTKAGGPNYLIGLGSWTPQESTAPTVALAPKVTALRRSIEGLEDAASAIRGMQSDAAAWASHFAAADRSALESERNVLRYRPVRNAVLIRHEAGATSAQLARVVAAAALAEAPIVVSVEAEPSAELADAIRAVGALHVEDAAAWAARAAALGGGRVRLVGADSAPVLAATGARPDLAIYAGPVTESGRVELLPFLQEQAVSVTAHRFGTPRGVPALF
jgi:RHH-type proline utilization regulon transcriptional repressor/proline dehydrogenase/delta 1-pyrroline-5-carboxylate dehydrogenase